MPKHRRGRRPTPIDAQLRLDSWGSRGTVRADLDERRVLVAGGLPGEVVEARVQRGRPPWKADVSAVLTPSPARITPACMYVHQGCGGCQWQHLDYPSQLEAKRQIVEGALRDADVDHGVDTVHAMDVPWRYRHTAAIAIGWEAGFRPRGRRGIVEIRDCPISHPLTGRLSHDLNDLLRTGALPNYHGKVWIDSTVVGPNEDRRLQLMLQGIAGLTPETHPEIVDVAATLCALPYVGSVAYRHRDGAARAILGPLVSPVQVGPFTYHLPAGSFFQTNFTMLERIVDRMRHAVLAGGAGHVADVYGGVGTLGLPLARLTGEVTLIELDPAAVEAAKCTAAQLGLENVNFVSAHAERALQSIRDLDLIIVDPPRSGLGEVVTGAVAASTAQRVLYLSCSAMSLAPDLAHLIEHGFHVSGLDLYDFYPQTYHVECLAILDR